MIDWSRATVVDRARDRFTRWINEAVYTYPQGRTTSVNRDESSYLLYSVRHTYDRFPDTTRSRRLTTSTASSDEGSDKGRNVKNQYNLAVFY